MSHQRALVQDDFSCLDQVKKANLKSVQESKLQENNLQENEL